MLQKKITQQDKVAMLRRSTHESVYETWSEDDLLKVLLSIAESLAIIADRMNEK